MQRLTAALNFGQGFAALELDPSGESNSLKR